MRCPGFDRSSRRRLRRPRRRHLRRLRGDPRLPRAHRRGAHGRDRRARPCGAETAVAVPTGGDAPGRRRRRRDGRAHPGGDAGHDRGGPAGRARARASCAATRTSRRGRRSSARGRPLRAQDLAMLAACGIVEVDGPRPPRAWRSSPPATRSSPRDAGRLHPGQVRDALSVSIGALVARGGRPAARVGDRPRRPPALCRTALRQAAGDSDLVVVCAGSSVGGTRRDGRCGRRARRRRRSGATAWRSSPASRRCWPTATGSRSSGCPATPARRWWSSG